MPHEFLTFNGIKTFIKYNNFQLVNWDEIKNDPTKIPFIIQHGHTANHNFVKPIYDYFQHRGWPIISFDWRGHGWSQKNLTEKYSMDDCVEDLYAVYTDFIKGKYGYQKFHLLGHSMGGFIGLKYLIKYQDTVSKFIALATSSNLVSNPLSYLIGKIFLTLWKRNYDYFFQKKKKNHIELGIENFPQWEDTSLMPDKKATLDFMEEILKYDVRKSLKNIQVPTYVCVGSKDALVKSCRKIAKNIPNSKLEIMEGYVHNIPIHAKDKLSEKIYEFLKLN